VAAPSEYKFAAKPEKKTGWDGFVAFMWNGETGEFMGRTGLSWLKIGIFYVVYYSCLAAFFMLMLLVFFTTLYDDRPTWLNKNSIIGSNPGVGYRPMPHTDNIESTLIWFRHGKTNGNFEPWVQRLNESLKDYINEDHQKAKEGSKNHPVECLETKGSGTSGICKINQEKLFQGRCNESQNYGFADGRPCILIKLNKIYGWEPQPYKNVTEMPADIPPVIRESFLQNIEDGKEHLNEKVWLHCDGENPADKEHIGPITYYPDRGFSADFYPFENQDQYLAPVVFAALDDPDKGVMIAIECKAWANEIERDSMDRKGLVHFELMID